jgi:hypothetical protein
MRLDESTVVRIPLDGGDSPTYVGGSSAGVPIRCRTWTFPASITNALGVGCACRTYSYTVGRRPVALCHPYDDGKTFVCIFVDDEPDVREEAR